MTRKKFWDDAIASEDIIISTTKQTDFAEEVLTIIKPNSRILDLGCGLGNDDTIFAQAGHIILATDFSEVAISKCSKRFSNYSNLKFEILDLTEPFRFSDNEFDVVYAKLSLHYFTDQVTKEIFNEIYRVLKPSGYFCFLCKSIKDKYYGKGKVIEKDMFKNNEHIKHFFSEEYTKSLLKDKFVIAKIVNGYEKFYGNDHAFIKVIAQAVK